MVADQKVNALFATMSRSLKLPSLALDPSGACAGKLGDSLEFVFELSEDQSELLLSAGILLIGEGTDPHCLRKILAANLFQRGSSPGVFALDEAASEIVLCCRWALDSLTVEILAQDFVAFLECAVAWKEQLKEENVDSGVLTSVANFENFLSV